MKKRNRKEGGYVLGWVIIMIMVLMIFMIAILSISSAYYRQIVREYHQKQAYLTARSIAELTAADFSGSGSGELREAITDRLFPHSGDSDEEEGEDSGTEEESETPSNASRAAKTADADLHEGGSERIDLPEIQFQLEASMGRGTMTGYYLPKQSCLVMTATAVKKQCRESVTVYIRKNSGEDDQPWTVLGYKRGISGGNE